MNTRLTAALVGAILFFQAALANAALINVVLSPESQYSVTRETSNGILQNIWEYGYTDVDYGAVTFDTVTGVLTIPFTMAGSGEWASSGERHEWITTEVLRVNTFGPTASASLERLSCEANITPSACDVFLVSGLFDFDQVSAVVSLNSAGTRMLGYEVAGTFSNLGSVSTMTADFAVPVPAAAWLFGSALLGLAATRRRQAARNNLAT
ncbi:VPLPA-CTERM sorting domain-containing protein [Haliea sp. E17]|uniref:VPLPA-CTERM sorting domain-containing protein n=1 Tax=Haliea sp. E17 TaxID=3401576 RepID=UPI003AAC8164